MKQILENQDGIFPRRRLRAETPAEMRQILDTAAKRFAAWRSKPFLEKLSRMECDVKAILDADSATVDAGVLDDANEVASYCAALRQELNAGSAETAAELGISLGRAWEKLTVRQFEPKVRHAKKVQQGLCKGREQKAQNVANQRKKITAAVKARLAANNKESLHSARQHIASQLGISFDTVKRATAHLKPRKKIKK